MAEFFLSFCIPQCIAENMFIRQQKVIQIHLIVDFNPIKSFLVILLKNQTAQRK
jgi:hypothetical protein